MRPSTEEFTHPLRSSSIALQSTKRLALSACSSSNAEEEEREKEVSAEELFDADLILMAGELSQVLRDLSQTLGVELKSGNAEATA